VQRMVGCLGIAMHEIIDYGMSVLEQYALFGVSGLQLNEPADVVLFHVGCLTMDRSA